MGMVEQCFALECMMERGGGREREGEVVSPREIGGKSGAEGLLYRSYMEGKSESRFITAVFTLLWLKTILVVGQ